MLSLIYHNGGDGYGWLLFLFAALDYFDKKLLLIFIAIITIK